MSIIRESELMIRSCSLGYNYQRDDSGWVATHVRIIVNWMMNPASKLAYDGGNQKLGILPISGYRRIRL
jgi:hypothetical protein